MTVIRFETFRASSGASNKSPVMPYTIGLDYGTNSARALVVDCADGREIGTAVVDYPSGHQGILLNPADHHLARQNPGGLSVRAGTGDAAGARRRPGRRAVVFRRPGRSASAWTAPAPARSRWMQRNVPLASDPKFSEQPRTPSAGSGKTTPAFRKPRPSPKPPAKLRPQYLAKIGGTYSSEWFWAKVWHCLKVDPAVFDAAYSWVELADFIPAVLAGVTDPRAIMRGVCMAGHKALYAEDWGGLPDKEFLTALDPEARRPARPPLRQGPRRLRHRRQSLPGVGGETRPARRHPHRHRRDGRPLRRHRLRRG